MRVSRSAPTNMSLPMSTEPKPLLPRQLSEAEFHALGSAANRREVAQGETLFRRGELGHSMFVIESGQVCLQFGDGLPDKLIGPREYFGELALLIGNHSRVASARADSNCVVHVVDQASFDRLLQESPALLAQFMRRSFAYLVASEQQLVSSLKRRNEDLLVTLDSLRQTKSELSATEHLVRTDVLTGLYNRRGLYAWVESLPENLDTTPVALLLIDLDRFKHINDRYGHLTGDAALQAVSNEVAAAGTERDLPCRLGGDELALLLHINDAEDAKRAAERILSSVRSLRVHSNNGESVALSVSIGLATRRAGMDWPSWYSEADTALYRVKSQGGDDWHGI